MKYKLIKEYPGSPSLGTEVEQEPSSKSYFFRSGNKNLCVLNNHVEDNPEYWEKVDEATLIYMVITEKGDNYFKTFLTANYLHQGIKYDDRVFFKTKEEADEFILNIKPCLSYSDIMWNFKENTKKNSVSIDIEELIALIKSKI